MLQPGKLVVSDDLSQPFSKDWFANKGKWDVVDGVMCRRITRRHARRRAAQRQVRQRHRAVRVQVRRGHDGVLEHERRAGPRLPRARFTPAGFTVIRDKDKTNSGKPIEMDTCKIDLKPGTWHTMVVEMAGKDMLARLDDKAVAFGSNPGLTTPKASVGFTVKGDSMSFKNLRVYKGTPLKAWEETRAKLTAERKK